MRHFARTSFGMLALGLIAPITSSAQQYNPATASGPYMPMIVPGAQPAPAAAPTPSQAPAGYQPAPAAQPSTPDASTSSATPAPVAAPTPPLQHIHKWRTVCPACAAKTAGAMPPGKIVGCAHSRNGVCTQCKAALDAPGTFVQVGAPVASAPGRAVVASAPSAAEEGMADPAPVGVVQAGYSQGYGTMPMQAQAGMASQANAPGRAVAESAPGHDFYHEKSNNGFPHPHILGHLFGWSEIGSARREEKARKKAEAHAMITYDPNAPTGVSELPASAVFGKQK